MKKVTVIGGGTGSFIVLTGLKKYPVDLAAIITMMDSGGSTGKLRDQLGVLPPGDLRQCLVALSEASNLWRQLFLYRFEQGDLKGHNFGNIFISALEKVSTNYDEVIETANYVLKTKGQVIPVTFDKVHLCVEYEDGHVIKGESNIDENNTNPHRIVRAFLEPKASLNPKAKQRLQESDVIILGPGDLYTSTIPVLLVEDVQEIIRSSKALIIYNLNLMSKYGQTSHYTAKDHVHDITHYLGREPNIVIENNGQIPIEIAKWYERYQETKIVNDLQADKFAGTIIEEDVIDRNVFAKNTSDVLTRSILRHDPEKLAKLLLRYI